MTQLQGSEDEDLVARTRDGDLHAFATLMRRHNQRLYRTARAIVGTDEEAEARRWSRRRRPTRCMHVNICAG